VRRLDAPLRHRVAASPPPVWIMRQAGRYLPEYRALRRQEGDFLKFCFNVELAATATLQPIERFDLDAAIIFSDILTIPHALGQHVAFHEGEGPKLGSITHPEDIRMLASAIDLSKLQATYDALAAVRRGLVHEKNLLGFCGMPWTLFLYMVEGKSPKDATRALLWWYGQHPLVVSLWQRLEDAVVAHAVAQLDAGADVIQLFDSWAGLAPGHLKEALILAPLRRISAAIKAQRPDAAIIAFPRGMGISLPQVFLVASVDGVSIDSESLLSISNNRVCLQGNIPPAALIAGGKTLEAAVREAKEAMRGKPWIANLGHGILPQTPPDHVSDFVRLVRADA
jgi:uroporphyrinogen decarboxylase